MGAVENARLMLASNVGNQNDLVGRYFADHPIPRDTATLVSFAGDLPGYYFNAAIFPSVLIRAIQTGSFEKSSDPYERLTQREKQVLQLIAHGKSNKEIAVMLDLSVNTVAVHRANLMSALGVHKTAELVLFAVKKGLVLPE